MNQRSDKVVSLACLPESNYVTGQVPICGGGRP
jgi:hypothetical protein